MEDGTGCLWGGEQRNEGGKDPRAHGTVANYLYLSRKARPWHWSVYLETELK